MKKENKEKLFNDFPILFSQIQKDWDNKIPIARFGFGCGDGWFDLIYELCEKLEKEIKGFPKEDQKNYRVFQIKEKFGALRFYLNCNADKLERMISRAEEKSAKICEICGADGKLRQDSWLKTLCDEHDEERKKSG